MSDPFPDSLLDELRRTGDEAGDTLIEYLAEQQSDLETLLALLENLVRIERADDLENVPLEEDAKARCRAFFVESARLPPWQRADRVRDGLETFRRHAFLAFIVLGCASLPACYCWRDEAAILVKAAGLVDYVPKRIPETAQMVLDAMSDGGLSLTLKGPGAGIRAARKVRMIHACIRYLQRHPFPRDDAVANGSSFFLPYVRWSSDPVPPPGGDEPLPINQEQLAATHLTFSCVILAGYAQVGVRLRSAEQEAYLHAWNVVGFLLGMDERVLGKLNTQADAQQLLAAVMRRNRGASLDGATLENALLGYMSGNIRRLAPILSALGACRWPKIVTSCLIERETAAALALELTAVDRLLRVPLRGGLRALGELENFRLTQRWAERVFLWLSRHMWDWRTDPETTRRPRAPVLPDDLCRAWGLRE